MLRREVLSLVTALGLFSSGIAVAQDATTPPPAAPPPAAPQSAVVGEAPAAAPAAKDDEKTEEIVVTGTRIRRKDLTTPAPVSVVNREQFTSSGKISLGEFLQTLPEQGNALNAQVNNGNDGSVRVDLRSLGSQRTLVLVNGRRFVAGGTGADSSPDLNTIPAAAVERIEVLKDGASAVYGSDAISGVVNVILKKRFNGTELGAYTGVSAEGDGTVYDFSATTGTGSDRGNILFAVGYQEQQKALAGDRKWAETTYGLGEWDGLDEPGLYPTGNSTTFPAGRFGIPNRATTCAAPPTPEMQTLCDLYAVDGVNSFVPVRDPVTGALSYQSYDFSLYNTNPTNYLVTPNRRIQVFAAGDTNLGDVARGFFEASYVNRNSAQSLAPMPLTNTTIPTAPVAVSRDSIYNPFGVNITSWRRRTVEFGDRRWSQDLDTFRVVAGLDGSLGGWAGPLQGWTWDVSYNYGRTAGTETNTGQLRMPNVGNATGPSMDPDGIPYSGDEICVRVANDPSTVIPGCVPWDVLSGVPSTPEQLAIAPAIKNYVSFDGILRGSNRQDVYSANVAGELFPLPTTDRPIGLAFGVDHRRESGEYLPDVITAALESSGNNVLPTRGEYDVTEGYAELSVPIVTGMPYVHDLEASAAVRVFDYSTFGSDSTYKLGARWSPVRDLTIRGTLSTAFRAPNIGELYGGTTDSYESVTDPCNGPTDPVIQGYCVADGIPGGDSQDPSTQMLTKWTANPDLQPETADIWTAGIVLEPRWVKNLSVTLDYYNIKIDGLISLSGANFILDRCYDPTGRDAAMCAQIDRGADGQILQIIDIRNNKYTYETAGLDFALRYGLPTPAFGRFNFVFDGTWLQYYRQIDEFGNATPGQGTYDLGVLPRIKFNTGVQWAKGGLGAGLFTRYVGGYKECASAICASDSSLSRRVESYMPLDVHVSYALKTAGTTTVALGMMNVLDENPPYLYNASAANSDPTAYDYLGRYVYARLTHNY